MKKLLLCIFFYITIYSPAYAETSVWKAQSNQFVTYIGGTSHILRATDYPLPKEFDDAYKDSNIIVFETDIGELKKPEIQRMIIIKGMYTDGSTLDRHLSPKTYDLLKKYCESVGVQIRSLQQFKPPLALLSLLSLELQKLGINQAGVDEFFFQMAVKEGKSMESLESTEEHIKYLTSMGAGNEDEFVAHSVKDFEKTARIFEDLINAWKKGDEKRLYELFLEDMKKDYPELLQTLIIDRNRKWLPKIETYLRTPEKEFVLIGAGHLVGEDGIIEQLRKRGYRVDKLN